MSTIIKPTKPLPTDVRLGFVVSQFNQEITTKLLNSALDQCRAVDISENNIVVVHVPGAVEIPYAAQKLAKTKKMEAIIALGAVIYGETDHYHYVCEQVNQGCQQVMLSHNTPVIFGVITVRSMQQALDRCDGIKGNMGAEALKTALSMIDVTRQIDSLFT